MVEYHLYRVKFIKPTQRSFLHEEITSETVLLLSIDERPSAEAKAGYKWHIGNVQKFTETTGYFAVGRTTNSTIEKFDIRSGNFLEEELEESPYTHCVFNASIGIIGIAKKSQLSPTTKGIANRLEHLFSTTNVVSTNGIAVQVLPIPDPEGFIKLLDDAFRVFRFSATFRGPNPFDADDFFKNHFPFIFLQQTAKREKPLLMEKTLIVRY